jgi:hypothetical protein
MDCGTVGTILQLTGVAVTGLGFWRTWREFGEPGEGFFDPVTNAARVGWARLWAIAESAVRRLLRRPRPIVLEPGPATARLQAFDARAHIGFAPLPEDPAAALEALARRTEDLLKRISGLTEESRDGLQEVRAEIADLTSRLDTTAGDLRRRTRRVAVGGIRLEALGLVLVALGTALQQLAVC